MHTITIPASHGEAAPPAAIISARDVMRRYGAGETAVDALGGGGIVGDAGALSAHEVVVAMEELSTR